MARTGGAVIYGRSDATINRHGIRMGTAELYRAVEALPEVLDSLVVDLEYLGRDSWMPLFVVLRDGLTLDAALEAAARRHQGGAVGRATCPTTIYQVPAIPAHAVGQEDGTAGEEAADGRRPGDSVLNRDAMANAASLDWFVESTGWRNGRRCAGDRRC
jgi:acetoacetyl-CoA synthetase